MLLVDEIEELGIYPTKIVKFDNIIKVSWQTAKFDCYFNFALTKTPHTNIYQIDCLLNIGEEIIVESYNLINIYKFIYLEKAYDDTNNQLYYKLLVILLKNIYFTNKIFITTRQNLENNIYKLLLKICDPYNIPNHLIYLIHGHCLSDQFNSWFNIKISENLFSEQHLDDCKVIFHQPNINESVKRSNTQRRYNRTNR
jgi:hypothetical protein